MDRSERKDRIVDLIVRIDDLQSELRGYDEIIDKCIKQAEILDSIFAELPSEVDGWELGDILQNITKSAIDGSIYEDVKDEIQGFKNELEEYFSELSEKKREKLEEKYYCLQELVDYFEFEEGTVMDDLLFDITQAKELLEDLKKNP